MRQQLSRSLSKPLEVWLVVLSQYIMLPLPHFFKLKGVFFPLVKQIQTEVCTCLRRKKPLLIAALLPKQMKLNSGHVAFVGLKLDSSIAATGLSAGHKTSRNYHQIWSLVSHRDVLFVHLLRLFRHLLSVSLHLCTFMYVCMFLSLHLHSQDEETIPVELRNLPEYKELLELKRLKKQTLQEIREDKVGARHVGYKVKTLHTSTQHTDNITAGCYIYMCP